MECINIAQSLLKEADIKINGDNPWDITIHNEKFYQRVLSKGSMGLGESYMDGWWGCDRLDDFFYRVLSSNLKDKVGKLSVLPYIIKAMIFNLENKRRAFQVGEKHYDIGNELYQNMLDKRMAYSCGYWKNANTLDEAQEAKLDLICRKLDLKPGMRILDIGCGWASFIKYASEKYKVKALGVTISKEQAKLGREICENLPIEIRLQDYRELNEKFDRIVSIGMFEHVGYKNYRTFMEVAGRNLDNKGLFLLHTIGGNQSSVATDPWIDKYIFPNSLLPSIKQIAKAMEGLFIMEDWHNFGADYDKTLMAWHKNFNSSWDKIRSNYNERFFRMWNYYLLSCAGSFRARKNQLWQIVLSKKGVPGLYRSIR